MAKKSRNNFKGTKNLGNIPDKWCYDGGKLHMLFREGGCSYIIRQKALLSECVGESKIGILGDGSKFILWMDKYSPKLSL